MQSTAKSWKPTKKWLAAAAGGIGSILVHFGATEFTFGDSEQAMLANLAAALLLGYIKRNDQTLEGVPVDRHVL